MCVGIPMQVIECHGYVALCQGRGGPRQLDLALVGEQPPGTWLLSFIDAAREVIDADTAARIDAALDGLEAVMSGETDISRHFADLIDRIPELPPHLRVPPESAARITPPEGGKENLGRPCVFLRGAST